MKIKVEHEAAGYKVAVCEQLEDPAEAKKRGSKSIVQRGVVRVITPGTLTEEGLLNARSANRLAACAFDGAKSAIVWADISTGMLETRSLDSAGLEEELASLTPAELLVVETDAGRVNEAARISGAVVTTRPALKADVKSAERRIKAVFEVAALDAYGEFTPVELAALGLLLDYIELTQAGAAPRLQPPRRVSARAHMAIDAATRAALELDRTTRNERAGSLLACIDRTVTAPGGRLLADRISRPLTDVVAINDRLDAVAFFLAERERRECQRQRRPKSPAVETLAPESGLRVEVVEPQEGLAVRLGETQQ